MPSSVQAAGSFASWHVHEVYAGAAAAYAGAAAAYAQQSFRTTRSVLTKQSQCQVHAQFNLD